jgi:hypothetical protein
MNLPLHHVLSDLSGDSGLRILDAILAGEREAKTLAALIDERVHSTRAQVEAALRGRYLPEQLLVIRQELASYRVARKQIARLEAEVEKQLAAWPTAEAAATPPVTPPATPAGPAGETKKARRPRHRTVQERSLAAQLQRVLGLDLTLVPGLGVLALLALIAEIGLEMSPWRSAQAFTSWLGLCPGSRISGGRVLSAHTRKVKSRAAAIFRLAAMAAGKTDTPLGAFYRRKRAQFGAPKANVATARKIAVLVYHLLSRHENYHAQDADAYDAKQKIIQIAQLRKRAQKLGCELVARQAA